MGSDLYLHCSGIGTPEEEAVRYYIEVDDLEAAARHGGSHADRLADYLGVSNEELLKMASILNKIESWGPPGCGFFDFGCQIDELRDTPLIPIPIPLPVPIPV